MAVTTSQITITTMEGWYSGERPDHPLVGDLWLDTTDNKIKKWNGNDWELQADAQGPQGPPGDSIISREAYWIKSSTKPNKPNPTSINNWNEGSEPSKDVLNNIGETDKFWRVYKETYSNGNITYSEVEKIGSYEVLNGLVQFRNGVTTTENVGGQDVTVIDGGKIKTGSIEAKQIDLDSIARIGSADSRHVLIDSLGTHIKDGDEVVATFGEKTMFGSDDAYHLNLQSDRISMAYKSDEVFYVEGTFAKLPPSGATIYDLGKGERLESEVKPGARILVSTRYEYPAGYYKMDFTDIPEINEIYYVYLDGEREPDQAVLQAFCYAYIFFSDINTIYVDTDGTIPLEIKARVDTNIVGSIDVAGDLTVGGHSTPIGWTKYNTNSTATAISSSNTSSWRSVKASMTLPAGSYVIKGRLHYGNHTTVSGSTNASAGKRSIRLCSDSSGETGYDRTVVTGYITAGQSYYIETVMFRKFTSDNNYVGVQPYSTTAVTVEGGSVEAIRIS